MLACIYIILMILLVYGLVSFFGLRIYRHLKTMATGHLSEEKAKALNIQISTALLLQAGVPLIVEFLPSLHLTVGVLMSSDISAMSVYVTAFFVWIPVINPLVTMWTIKAFRTLI